MSQRRALSKRINSPPPNRYIFNRDQSTQNKIQCQTHSPFTSPFWVWTKPEAPIPRISVQSTVCLDGYYFSSFMVATPITSVSSVHPSNVKIVGLQTSSALRLLNVNRLFEMRWTWPFQIIHVYLVFQINLSHGWTIQHSHFSSLVIILRLNTFNHHISSKQNKIGLFPLYIVYSIL